MISRMGKFDVQIGSAIANQRRIQPITVVGREDENLAFGPNSSATGCFQTLSNDLCFTLSHFLPHLRRSDSWLTKFFMALPSRCHLQLCRRHPRHSGGLKHVVHRWPRHHHNLFTTSLLTGCQPQLSLNVFVVPENVRTESVSSFSRSFPKMASMSSKTNNLGHCPHKVPHQCLPFMSISKSNRNQLTIAALS